jgi:hypothetical protein
MDSMGGCLEPLGEKFLRPHVAVIAHGALKAGRVIGRGAFLNARLGWES